MESRLSIRINISIPVTVICDNQRHSGEIKNIGLGGAFLRTEADLKEKDEFQVLINLDESPLKEIKIIAKTTRKDQDGFGIIIRCVDLNSLICLREMLTKNM